MKGSRSRSLRSGSSRTTTPTARGHLPNEDVAIVNIHSHRAARLAHDSFRHEVAHGPDDALQVGVHEPVHEVDDRGAVSLEGRNCYLGLVITDRYLSQRCNGVEPLRVLLETVEDKRLSHVSLVDQLLHIAHPRRVAERKAELCLQALCPGEFGG